MMYTDNIGRRAFVPSRVSVRGEDPLNDPIFDADGTQLVWPSERKDAEYMERVYGVKPAAPAKPPGESRDELAHLFGSTSDGKAANELGLRDIERYRQLRALAEKAGLL